MAVGEQPRGALLPLIVTKREQKGTEMYLGYAGLFAQCEFFLNYNGY